MNLKINKGILFSAFFLLFMGFSAKAQNTQGKVKIETDAKMDQIIKEKKKFNQQQKGVKGYRIQLFYGSEKGAYDLKEDFQNLYPDMKTKIIFSSPDWKVQAGNYLTRLEADSALVKVKKDFPSAIILSTQIDLD